MTKLLEAVGAPRATRRFGRAAIDKRGAAAVEFAIVGPLLFGIFTYGSYFLTAHTVQQLTNDAARAAIAGIDDEERQELAEANVRNSIQTHQLNGELIEIEVNRDGDMMSVRATYDGSKDLFARLGGLIPTPSPTLTRTAVVRLGGY